MSLSRRRESGADAPVVRRLAGPPGTAWRAGGDHLALAPAWYEIIRQVYQHEPLYLETEGARLPAFVIRRPLLGTVVASMPFLDAGGPAGPPARAAALLAALRDEAAACGARLLEIRSLRPLDLPGVPGLGKVSLTLALPRDPAALWDGLDPKVRNQVRKAERAGVTVAAGGGELLDEFYRVFAVNMRDLGSPVHARGFFAAVLEGLAGAEILVARRAGRPVGGLLAIPYGPSLYVPWASSLRTEAAHCPNMALYWKALGRACRAGLRRFDFGRSTRDSGTYQFKRQWGAEEVPLYWYTLPPSARGLATGGRGALARRVWQRLPVCITRLAGPLLRRLLTQ